MLQEAQSQKLRSKTDAAGLCLLSLTAIVVDRINICEEQFASQRVDDNQVAIPWQYYLVRR